MIISKPKPKISIDDLVKETRVYFYRSSGPGGQHKNKRETAVRLVHAPSGLRVIATEFRSQVQNKNLAFQRLKKRIIELTKKRKFRITTSIPIGLKERILKKKKVHSEIKKLRKKINFMEEE